ncbi:MAG: hypothetical protein JNJ41_01400 [Bacteroidia bacterium]|nr:hypothetical protein [Bacteroidia bacterium]
MHLYKTIKQLNANWVILITLIAITWVNFNIVRWQKGNIITNDVISYYCYLPATFYEHDLSLAFTDDSLNRELEGRYYWPSIDANGNKIIKVNMGMAVSYLPFFAAAHVYCKLFNEEANGFSDPYHFAVQFSSLFYFLIGLFFLLKILKLYFNQKVVFITSLAIIFGTNIIYYLTNGAGMAHPVDFSLIAAFIYYTVKWHQSQTLKRTLIIGLLGGMITLVRPINIFIFFVFFFYNVSSFKDVSVKIKFFLKNYKHLFLIAICGVLIYLPQLIYWKYVTGNYFVNSYMGERFYFNNPHIIDGLFSFRKGWLVYSPIMIFSLIGFYYLRKNNKLLFVTLLLFTLFYFYIVFSWWCWWYGGSYSQRALIDIYPLLAIPFAAFVAHIQNFNKLKRSVVYTLMVLCLLLNIFQTMQAKWNIIHYDSMTREAYFDALFRITKNPEREKFLKHPDYDKAMRGIDEY